MEKKYLETNWSYGAEITPEILKVNGFSLDLYDERKKEYLISDGETDSIIFIKKFKPTRFSEELLDLHEMIISGKTSEEIEKVKSKLEVSLKIKFGDIKEVRLKHMNEYMENAF